MLIIFMVFDNPLCGTRKNVFGANFIHSRFDSLDVTIMGLMQNHFHVNNKQILHNSVETSKKNNYILYSLARL